MEDGKMPAEVGASDRQEKAATQRTDYLSAASENKAACSDAVEFLEVMHPAPLPWVLTGKEPDGPGIETRTFVSSPARAEQARRWVADYNGRWNLYWQVNPPLKPLTKKASKTDIKEVAFLHLDLDPRPGMPLAEEQERLRLLTGENLPPGVPSASARVWSGGGVQLLWRLEQPIPVDGDLALAEEAARYNRWLEGIFGGDKCHDVSRILRLPFTTNIPDETKRKKSRVEAEAYVMELDPARAYPVSAFNKAPPKTGSVSPVAKVSIARPLPAVALDDLPEGVSQRIKAVIVCGTDPLEPARYGSRSDAVIGVAIALVQAGCSDEIIASILLDRNYGISEHLYTQKGRSPSGCAARQIEEARKKVAARPATPDQGDDNGPDEDDEDKPTPTKLAKAWLGGRRSRLIRYDGEWLAYDTGAYVAREDEGMRAEVWRAYPKANSAVVSNVLDAAKGLIHLDKNSATPPCWLDGRVQPDPAKLLALRNGVLDLESGVLSPHADQLFTRNALDFDYDANAPTPTRFLKFLDEVWPDPNDHDCHTALQQMFGYLLTPDTSQQKIFVMVGPPRSGKGTIGRLLERILGELSVCSLTFSSMGTPFGRQSMIGKRLALVSDMRIGKLTDRAAVAETLLTISGEDTVSVPRKHMTDWSGHLPVRFVILSNEPPTLDDPSGALLSRYIMLETQQSFMGSEDRTLDAQLEAELPGILNWAIDGWKALQNAGQFTQPVSAAEMAESITRIGSPIAAFVQDECELDPDATVSKDDVFKRFKTWCADQGRDHHGNKETFSKGLLVSCRGVRSSKARDGDERTPVYRGLKLKPEPF